MEAMEKNYTLVSSLAAEVRIPEKGILSHTLHDDESVKIVLFGFAAGQELSAHTAPMPAMIHLLGGEAKLTLGDDTIDAAAGTLVHMQPKLNHGILAKTPLLMLLTLVKADRVRTG
jgi:quercetin dioxygenase-like cupin family protein